MTNFKKMALGLLVAVLAVGFSAFTAKQKETNLSTIYYGYDNQDGMYKLIPGTPDPNNCFPDQHTCVVIADSEDGLDEELTPTQVQQLGLQPWSESSENSRYEFN